MPTIKNRRATDAQWAAQNPILASGEIGYEINTNSMKIGNGFSTWSELRYIIDKAAVEALIAAAGGGGGGNAPIDDGVIALDKLWSSQKTSAELDEKANDMFVIMAEGNVFINPISGEIVDLPMSETKYGLQMGLAMIYQMAAGSALKYAESAVLIPGTVAVGGSSRYNGIQANPATMDLNNVSVMSVSLATPSTSGQIKFCLAHWSDGGGSGQSGADFIIPQGVKEVYYDTQGFETRPNYYLSDFKDVMVVNIKEAGTGATGFKVRTIRSDQPI